MKFVKIALIVAVVAIALFAANKLAFLKSSTDIKSLQGLDRKLWVWVTPYS